MDIFDLLHSKVAAWWNRKAAELYCALVGRYPDRIEVESLTLERYTAQAITRHVRI